MTLRAKLSRLQAFKEGRGQQPVASTTDLQQRLARINRTRLPGESKQQQKSAEARLARQLKGYPVSEGLLRIYRRIPLHGSMGRYPLSLLQQQPRLPGESGLADRRHVYFDTETTGLSGGSGTLAFLFGFATVEQECLQLTQFLITRFAGEAAMLEAIDKVLSVEDRLVSYNGKRYDLPLMKTRYRMCNRPTLLDQLPHLDLLHPTRRLFRSAWPDCRLMTLEQRLLGLERQNDMPGSAAPQAWFDFIKTGATARLARVVEHNTQDILSLAMAHVALTHAIEQPQHHGADIAALARWQADHDPGAAYALLKRYQQTLPMSGKRLLGRLARGFSDWELALEVWEGLAQKGCQSATEQLAKYHEHISRDLKRAKHYCEQLPIDDDQQRRMKRIACKLYGEEIQPSLHP
ncbi:MAG: ribonuclease H-like domain-containing protein [Candidatus Thiodiazotropha sp.]